MIPIEQITGLQHIGIPVLNLNESLYFYECLGFKCIHQKDIIRPEGHIQVAFIQIGELVIELYEFKDEYLEEISHRKDGHIDHIAINVKDIKVIYDYMVKNHFKIIDDEIQFIPFFEKGVKFFTILGPNGEKIEFNQSL